MDLMGQLGDLLSQYGGGQNEQVHNEVEQHFDKFSQAAPTASLAEGLLAAFGDTQRTPSFANQAASLFGASGGDTKAQVLNSLLAVAGPMLLQQMSGGGAQQRGGGMESALAGLMGGGGGGGAASMLGGLLGGGAGGGMASMLGGLIGGGGGASMLEGLLSGRQQVTPELAAQVPDEVVEKLANQAAEQDPGIMGQLSEIYAAHPTLIKTLGGAALTIAMSRMADHSRRS